MKKLLSAILLAALALPPAFAAALPDWMKLESNGQFDIDGVRSLFSIKGAGGHVLEDGNNSRFQENPLTIELDSRIIRARFSPWRNGPAIIADKKFAVHSADAVNVHYQLRTAQPVRTTQLQLRLLIPLELAGRAIELDNQVMELPAKPAANPLLRQCRASRIKLPLGSGELTISGKFQLLIQDPRIWNVPGFYLIFEIVPPNQSWQQADFELDLRFLRNRVGGQAFDRLKQTFTPIPLDLFVNSSTCDDAPDNGRGGWTDQGAINDLRAFAFKGVTKFNHIPFVITDPACHQGRNIVMAGGRKRNRLPRAVTISLGNRTAGGIYFLHTSAWTAPLSGHYRVRYADGKTETIPLRKSQEIFDWWNVGSSADAAVGWTGSNPVRANLGIGILRWANPRPDAPLADLTLEVAPDADETYLMLLGVTLVDRAPFLPADESAKPEFDDSNWIAYTGFDAQAVQGSILDVSQLLHKPAGKYGRVRVDGDSFRFANGQKAHFMGVVISSPDSIQSHEASDFHARRLSRIGVNIVRLGMGLDDYRRPGNRILNEDHTGFRPDVLDKFQYFTAQLKKQGIYWFLDLHTNRRVLPSEAPELAGVRFASNAIVMPRLRQLQKEYITRLLTTVNPYTQLSFRDDPALAMLLLSNEDTLLYQPARNLIDHPLVLAELKRGFSTWLLKQYGTRAKLAQTWGSSLAAGEDPAAGTVELPVNYPERRFSPARVADSRNYLARLQREYYAEMIAHIRSLGCHAPVTGSDHWTRDLADLAANAETDFIDRHAYWAHPTVSGSWAFDKVLFNPNASLHSPLGGFLADMASRRVIGKPFTLSEWNVGGTNEFRADAQLFLPAYAALNNWHLFQFQYSMQDKPEGKQHRAMVYPFGLNDDPLQMELYPATALLFHRNDVAEATAQYVETISPKALADPSHQFDPTRVVRASMRGKAGVSFRPGTPSDAALPPSAEAAMVATPNGELTWDSQRGMCRIDTARSQGFTGFTADKPVLCRDAAFHIRTDFAALLLTSFDARPLTDSRRMLLTAVARCRNRGTKYNTLHNRITDAGKLPVVFQPVEGEITLRTTVPLAIYPVDFSGRRGKKLAVRREPGKLTFPVGTSIHYELIQE